jgi:glycerate-2-kinase
VKIDLVQLGRVKRSRSEFEVTTVTIEDEDDPEPLKRASVSIICSNADRSVDTTARSNSKGIATFTMSDTKSGMNCRAQGRFFGSIERSNRVRLR